ncbi:MAG: type IV pilus secretin PilQ [Pseudomonadota bacterium]
MFYQERKKFRKIIFIGVAVSVFLFLFACATNKASKIDPVEGSTQNVETENKLITDIVIEDGKDPVTISIKGNQLLTYTAVKQPLPLGLVLYFPETSLGIAKREYQAESDIVASIKAVELIENGPSKVTISLKTDSEPIINRNGNGLTISFSLNQQEQTKEMGQSDSEDQQRPIQNAEFVEEGSVSSEAAESSANIEESVVAPVAEEVSAISTPIAETAIVTGETPEAPLPQATVDVDDGINNFREISAVNADDGVSVLIRSDHMINDYKAFALADPPRIVLDLNNVKSDFKKQQTVAVDSKWVKKIRHFAYPGRLRVVLDTDKAYLSSYTVEPSENGLIVMIADSIEPEKVSPKMETAGPGPEKIPAEPIIVEEEKAQEQVAVESTVIEKPENISVVEPVVSGSYPSASPVIEADPIQPAESISVKTALVNRIDFLSGDEGKSSIIIGTTRPVKYNLDKNEGVKLSLDLFDTKILSYRQRPLITTRFESAVNRIIPIQTAGMKNNSKILIELRESVPFTIENKENEIEIQFEASTIPPQSLEKAGLPPWEKVMEEAALEAETMIAKAEHSTPPGPAAIAPSEIESLSEEDMAVRDRQAVDNEESLEAPVIATVEPMPAPIEIVSEKMPVGMADAEDLKVDEKILPELAEEDAEPAEEKKKKVAHRRYTGEKIALDFYQTDIKNVLRILRDVSGKNFAIDKDVTGSVTLTLVKPIPWDQVLDLILKMNQLGQISEGDIVRIVTISTLRKEEKIRSDELKAAQSIQEQQKALEPLVTEYIPINYADANADIKPRLDQIKTNKRGQIGVDARNNQIIMTDTMEKIAQAKEIIRSIDKVTPQVVIEARIVEVSENFSRDIGTQWGLTDGPVINGSDSHTYTLAMNHPPAANSGSIGYQFSRLAGTNFSLNAELQAVEAAGEGKIISTPKIVTLDNKEATIAQGIEYPYLERDSSGLSTTKFKDIDLELKVKPHVTPDNRINLNINITKNDIDSITGGVPSLSTNEAKTELLVNDGDTIVIGGILKTNIAQGERRFPMLADIPVLGWLFKSRNNSTQKNELLIFITPKIVHLESNL